MHSGVNASGSSRDVVVSSDAVCDVDGGGVETVEDQLTDRARPVTPWLCCPARTGWYFCQVSFEAA